MVFVVVTRYDDFGCITDKHARILKYIAPLAHLGLYMNRVEMITSVFKFI